MKYPTHKTGNNACHVEYASYSNRWLNKNLNMLNKELYHEEFINAHNFVLSTRANILSKEVQMPNCLGLKKNIHFRRSGFA